MFTMYRNREIHVHKGTGIGKNIFTMYRNREIHVHNVQE